MKPPTRKRATRHKDLPIEEYSKWTLSERQRLLKALKTYSSNQISEIAKIVATKSEAEVTFYLTKLKRSLRFDIAAAENISYRKHIKNLETWIRFTHQLVDDEEEAYSTMIGKLLALYGEYCFKKVDTSSGVNFKSIYDYIAGLLLGVRLPVLPPLEAALVLDLLKNVASFLAQSNINAHKKFVLWNYEKHLYPNFSQSDKNKKSILKNLLDDVPVPVNATSSSISLPLKTQCTPRIMKNRYENEICKNTLVTVIHLKENEALSVQTKSTSHIQKPKVSKKPLKKRKLLCNSSTSVKGASASSEIKITSAIDKEKQTLVEQDEIPKVIPSTSKMVKPGTSSLLTVEENSVTNLHSISAMQQEPTILVLPSIEVVQQGKDCTIVGQIPNRDIAQEMFSSSNTNQAPRKSNILSNASKLLQVPIRGSVLPIPNSGKVIEGQDGKLPSGTAVPQKPDTDSTFLGNNSSLVSKETNESGITVQKKSILVSPFQNLSRSAILQKTDSTSQTSNKIVHQDANGGTIKKKPLVSILCKPVIDTVQQETSSAKNSQMTNSGLVCQGSGSSASVQTSIKGIVHQKTSNPKIFKVTNSGLVCQGSGRSTSAQTSNKGTVHQESSSAKIFKVTNSGLVCQGSGISSSVQTPNRGTVNQETSSAKVFQVTNSGLVSQASSTSTSLKTLCKDTVQKEASNVKPSQTKARIITEQVSGEARPLQVPNKKLDEQIPGISAKNYLPKSFEHNQKRKLFSAEFEMSSKKNIKHCKLSTDQSINSKSSDSVPEAVNGAYKPSISWLNPMNIPSSLVNLNKTKQRITK